MEPIVNKIAQSGIITLDLENFLPGKDAIAEFDLKPFLFKEMILREKDFRTAMAALDGAVYQDRTVAVFCSADAIIPKWAYMLVGSLLGPYAAGVYFGTGAEVEERLLLAAVAAIEVSRYAGQRVIIKGCGERNMPDSAYLAVTMKLRPVVKSLMYGEACSTVPVYKEKKPKAL
jgi:hypothetical protein